MAIGNTESTEINRTGKQYSTNEADMLKDAKAYASRDFSSTLETLKQLKIKVTKEQTNTVDGESEILCEADVANALIEVKFRQIKEARTKRVSYFD